MTELTRSFALASRHTALGTRFEVSGDESNAGATVENVSFHDLDKSCTHA